MDLGDLQKCFFWLVLLGVVWFLRSKAASKVQRQMAVAGGLAPENGLPPQKSFPSESAAQLASFAIP